MADILGWIVWGFAALFVTAWTFVTVIKFVKKESTNWAVCFPILWGIAVLFVTATTDFSKFHLFWMIPLGVMFPLAILGYQLWLQFKSLGSSFKGIVEQFSQEAERQKAFYGNSLSYIDAEPGKFSHLDINWYDETAKEIETEINAKFVADLESPELSQIWSNLKTFIRTLTAEDGSLVFSLYSIRAFDDNGFLLQDMKTVDIETAFSDGSFLTTSNAVSSDGSCEGITFNQCPPEMLWHELLESHRNSVDEKIAEDGVTIIPINTKEEIIAAQIKQHEFRAKSKQLEWEEAENENNNEDDEDDES